MRWLLALVATALLSSGATACGGAGRGPSSVSHAASGFGRSPGAPGSVAPTIVSSGRPFLNDGDAEKVNDNDIDNRGANHEDGDGDSSEEYETTYDNSSYHDRDDGSVLVVGHAANAADSRAVAVLVRRYFAAAAADDGAKACSMMDRGLGKSVPEDFGGTSGLVYLRGAKTCEAVMALLFERHHTRLSGAIRVTGVRVSGANHALALVGSGTMSAADVTMNREDGAWRIGSLIGSALP